MIEVEFFVVLCCGFLGYGIVSFLIDYFRKKREIANTQTQVSEELSKNREDTSDGKSEDSNRVCCDIYFCGNVSTMSKPYVFVRVWTSRTSL